MEIGSLVYPNNNACYSIIPKDLSKIDWESKLDKITSSTLSLNIKKFSKIDFLISAFRTHKDGKTYEKSVCCIVSLCLSELLHAQFQQNVEKDLTTLIDGQNNTAPEKVYYQPRLKAATWISRLTEKFRQHLEGYLKLQQKNSSEIDDSHTDFQIYQSIEKYAENFAKEVTTQILIERKLLLCYKTITNQDNSTFEENPNYYVWAGSSLTGFPKTVALPMITEPISWILNSTDQDATDQVTTDKKDTYRDVSDEGGLLFIKIY